MNNEIEQIRRMVFTPLSGDQSKIKSLNQTSNVFTSKSTAISTLNFIQKNETISNNYKF